MTIFNSNLPVLLSCVKLKKDQGNVSHTACTERKCNANQVDDSNYTIRHFREGCTCEFVDVGNIYDGTTPDPPKPKFLSFGKPAMRVPAVTFAGGVLRVVLVEPRKRAAAKIKGVKSDSQSDFVAFSHVWAQGRGNPKANSLPQCQLAQLQVCQNIINPRELSNTAACKPSVPGRERSYPLLDRHDLYPHRANSTQSWYPVYETYL